MMVYDSVWAVLFTDLGVAIGQGACSGGYTALVGKSVGGILGESLGNWPRTHRGNAHAGPQSILLLASPQSSFSPRF